MATGTREKARFQTRSDERAPFQKKISVSRPKTGLQWNGLSVRQMSGIPRTCEMGSNGTVTR